jgi:membrane-associated phospholipid phosphatase
LALPAKDIKRHLKLLTVEVIAAAVIFIVSALMFGVITNEVILEKETSFDIKVYDIFTSFISPAKTNVAVVFSFIGSEYFLVPVYLVAIGYFIKIKKYRFAVLITAVALTSISSGLLLKVIFHRARPLLPLVVANGYSFPSGHSISGFTFSGLAIYIVWQSSLRVYVKWLLSVVFFFLGVFIALSRIYLRVHYASDVFGGLLLTPTWLSLSFIAMRYFEKKV